MRFDWFWDPGVYALTFDIGYGLGQLWIVLRPGPLNLSLSTD